MVRTRIKGEGKGLLQERSERIAALIVQAIDGGKAERTRGIIETRWENGEAPLGCRLW